MSITVPTDTKSVPRQSFYERWVQFVLLIQVKAANLYELSVLPSNSDDGSSLANVVYKIADQNIVVQDIDYCSQSGGSSTEMTSWVLPVEANGDGENRLVTFSQFVIDVCL